MINKKAPYIADGNYCVDAIEGMKRTGPVDVIITDPPYNAKDIGTKGRKYSHGPMQIALEDYKAFCHDWFLMADSLVQTLVFTPGIANMCYYPQPDWAICWHKASSPSFHGLGGGYNCWEPIFVYGSPVKRLKRDVVEYLVLNFKKGPERGHPCPKN